MPQDEPLVGKVAENLLWGVCLGVLFGGALSCIGILIYLLRGSQAFASNGVTLLGAIAGYFGCGIVVGIVVGLLRPLTKRRWGAAVVGAIATIPAYKLMRLTMDGVVSWTTQDIQGAVFFALVLGAPLGWTYWGIFRNTDQVP
jgi:hypothetical protein